jgi:CMP/dCMP kinase
VRAERRLAQSESQSPEEIQRVQAEIAARDERDRTRVASPLVPASDAVILDTTRMSIDQVVDAVYGIVRRRLE